MLKPFKIKVENPEHSEAIQEFVFKHGYTWCSGDNQATDMFYPFLYLSQDLEYNEERVSLKAGEYEDLFDEDKLPEKWFYDGKLQDKPEVINDPRSYLMLLLGTDEDIEYKNSDGEWKPFVIKSDYRIKPKPRYCNGVELDECLTEAPEIGAYYYSPVPMHIDYYNLKPWTGDADDIYWLEMGFAYGSSESAAKHGHAMGITTEG